MPVVEDGLGKQRPDYRAGGEDCSPTSTRLADLALLLGESFGTKFVNPFLESYHVSGACLHRRK